MSLEINKIYHGDCLEVLKTFPDDCIDLTVTSPPYNLGNTHHTSNFRHNPYEDNMAEEDYQNWQKTVLDEIYRVLKPGGSIIYNHKNRIRNHRQITPYEWILKTKLTIKQEIIWQNGTPCFDKIRFYPTTERVYWLSKTTNTGFFNHLNKNDILKIQPCGTKGNHKRAFPVDLVQVFLKCFPSAKKVLDPFAGSGTTGVACKNLARDYILIEKEEKYYKLAKERLENTPEPLIVEGD